ncbi:MAG: transaldolase, partial [Actinobacteria bacterium]
MDAMSRLIASDAVARLRAHDTSLYSTDYDTRKKIGERLGWTDLAEKAPGRFTLLENLAAQVVAEGCDDLVLLGMGGSSLAPLVLAGIAGPGAGFPRMHVLDTTCPRTVLGLLDSLDQERTFFVLASKSGTTIEPNYLYAIARAWTEERLARPAAGKRFIVVTDPGSALEKTRQRELMRVTLPGVQNVGGRFSALSMFGLAPAALIGVDLAEYVRIARDMELACALPAEQNPAARLAAWVFDSFQTCRDKLTLVCSPSLRPFGLWVGQLVAESTGKDGTGIVPVLEDDVAAEPGYGDDRAVFVLRTADDAALAEWAEAMRRTAPVEEVVLEAPIAIGAEFVRWEYATALLGHLLEVNPFDEPDVTEAKKATAAILGGTAQVLHASDDVADTWVTFAGALDRPDGGPGSVTGAVAHLLATIEPPDYLAMLAYLPYDESLLAPLREAWRQVGRTTRNATCFELGPRYLHSTGQLHKGGPDTGAFVLVTARDRTDTLVPGQPHTLGALFRAQAEGDLAALAT